MTNKLTNYISNHVIRAGGKFYGIDHNLSYLQFARVYVFHTDISVLALIP